MNELIPGMLAAVRDKRYDDAIELAETVVEQEGGAVSALLQTAALANQLHANPEVSLHQLVLYNRKGVDQTALPDISRELISVVESLVKNDGEPTREDLDILARFDRRPTSGVMMLEVCRLAVAIAAGTHLEGFFRGEFAAAVEKAAGELRAALPPAARTNEREE